MASAQGPQLQKILERLTGQHTVPNVFIGGKHIGGCTGIHAFSLSHYI
ncbi:hypothetical protein SLEP1_g726 [Rubroshorea leprosula]|uniref:Glutaredoxin domain-containing protein n=1 Tax=Rubroshorea leprosula TaxID=152421 RepID=A0AAV5HJT0_9ROSI|nr:hypothetical protein SLEP1_g726 [Rubroshorea leprosula]